METRLFGRVEEVAELTQSLTHFSPGKGGMVLVTGEAGIGKSRLVQTINEQVGQNGNAVILKLRCMDQHRNSAFYPLIDLLANQVLALEQEHLHEKKITKLIAWMDSTGIKKNKNPVRCKVQGENKRL